MSDPLVITGTGLLTAIEQAGGPNSVPDRTFAALCAGRFVQDRGIISEAVIAHGLRSASLSAGNRAILEDPAWDKSIRMGVYVALQALANAGWNPALWQQPDTGLFVGTSKGPVRSWLASAEDLHRKGKLTATQARQILHGPGVVADLIAEILHFRGMVHTSIAACSSGVCALHRAARALAWGECQRAVVVASDATADPFFEASFKNLGVLAPLGPDGHRHCYPFAKQSSKLASNSHGVAGGGGFFLSEGAAAVVLEKRSLVSSQNRAAQPIELVATWIGGDGTHLVAIDPQTESLQHGLRTVLDRINAGSPNPNPIAFVHAHATGTSHDQQELQAIQRVLPGMVVEPIRQNSEKTSRQSITSGVVFSHKQQLGHALGAAGLISVVLSAQSHQAGHTFNGSAIQSPCHSLTISQGFGGHIGIALLRG